MKVYITFGFDHSHQLGNTYFDHTCVAVLNLKDDTLIESIPGIVHNIFGDVYCRFEFDLERVGDMKHFARGLVTIPDNPKMSMDRFCAMIDRAYEKNTNWRQGQAAYNCLHQVNSGLAHEINNTEVDPFYDDSKLNSFFQYIKNRL
jgi:hypothetical protein